MVVPQLLLPGNIVQNSVKKFPTFLDKIRKIPGIFLSKKVSTNDFYKDFPFSESRAVDTAISACWFFSKKLLETVGFLDEAIFYAPEDVEYCFRVNKAGLQIIYYPQMSILHHTQQITHRKPFSKVSRSHFSGLLYYFHKHGGWISRPTFSHVPK
jgi:GT2 family glycosyltransferase